MSTPQTRQNPNPDNVDSPRGLAFAITAYGLWGFLPLYMKALSHIPAAEIVAHRVIWSVPLAGILLILLGRTNDLRIALQNPRMLGMACVTATLVSLNWGIYVWAISADRAMDAALGYYINPIFSVLLGAIILRERLTPLQWGAIALAAAAVLVLTIEAGSLPWPAVGMMLTWGFYALCKKSLPIGPNQGFMLEVLILLIPALAYTGYLATQGTGHFAITATDTWLLLGCGIVTAVPLMTYANGAKLLRLTTTGILQFIAPTLILLVAVFVFGEPFDGARLIAFPMIWLALIIYSFSLLRQMRSAKP
jgi:chloramphenicol-sensitive protein RarD